jgi:hypothetical protein
MFVRILAAVAVLLLAVQPVLAEDDDERVTPERPYAAEVGDLDGDEATDVVTKDRVQSYTQTGVGGSSLASSRWFRLTARSGVDGSVLWVHDDRADAVAASVHPVQFADGAGVVVASHTGMDRQPVMGECWNSVPLLGCNSYTVSAGARQTTLTALGGEGEPRWTRDFGQTVQVSSTVPQLGLSADVSAGADEVVATLRGASDRLAVVVRELPSASGGGGARAGRAATVLLLDPDTGEDAVSTIAVETVGELRWYVWPDLTAAGDGLLLVAGGDALALSIDGQRVFSTHVDLRPGEYLYPVGDVDGDGRPDMALTGKPWAATSLRSVVLSATGSVLAERARLPWVIPLGDVDGVAGDEVAFVDPGRTDASVPSGYRLVVTEVVNGAGVTIRSGEVLVPAEGTVYGYTGWPGRNDPDGDGLGDIVRLRVSGDAILGADLLSADPTRVVPLRGPGAPGGWAGRLSSVLGPDVLVTVEAVGDRLFATAHGADAGWVADLGAVKDAETATSSFNDVDRLGAEDDPEGYLVNWSFGGVHGTALLDLDGTLRWTTAVEPVE